MTNSKHALELLRNKDFEKAYHSFKSILDQNPNNEDRFRNLNNIMICTYFSYVKTRDVCWFESLEAFLMEYLAIAQASDTTTWANNILEDLLEYAIKAAFIRFTENHRPFAMQREDLRQWFDKTVAPFIETFSIEEKREPRIFFEVVLRVIFQERANFERNGHEYQNIVNTQALSQYFLHLIKKFEELRRTRSNLHLLFSELVYTDPEAGSQDYYFLTREAVKHLDKSLEELPTNQFAKKRREQLIDSLIIQEQLHRFDHDISSKIGTLVSLIRSFKRRAPDLDEPKRMERIINDIRVILNLSRNEVPEPEMVDVLETLNEIVHESPIETTLLHRGSPIAWLSNRAYLRIIFENLTKNSKEAYERRAIALPSPAILIEVDFDNGVIMVRDWAGGISEDLLRNNRIYEPYVSEKGVSQSTGLGLSLVKRACDMLSMSIDISVHDSSTLVTIKRLEE